MSVLGPFLVWYHADWQREFRWRIGSTELNVVGLDRAGYWMATTNVEPSQQAVEAAIEEYLATLKSLTERTGEEELE